MEYALNQKTFEVRELFNPKLTESGSYYYYILEKRGISHKEALRRIGVRAYFCGVKDRNATTKQWFCTFEKIDDVNEDDFKIKFRGSANERIHVGKHKGNAFSVRVKLSDNEKNIIKKFKAKDELVCNYFGEQRFSQNTKKIVHALEEKDYEQALKIFLTEKSKFDSEKSSTIKKLVSDNWGKWKELLEMDEIKGTGKVVLFEFLEKNPKNFSEAFHYTEEKSTKTLIKAAQAMRFNEELSKLAKKKKPNNIEAQILGQIFPIGASKAFPRNLLIAPTEFEKNFRKSGIDRKTFFIAEKFRAKAKEQNEFLLEFELMRGSYATVFLKFLDSWLKNKVNKG
jgi:TruD family tRNA pseudouridine synthase